MHRIDKFLARLDARRRGKALAVLERMQKGDFSGLDIKKLKGPSGIHRVRIRKIRITFVVGIHGVRVLTIENRAEDTYRGI